MWSYSGFAETGKRHREADMLCQDRIAYHSCGNRQAIALVDGIGKTDHNVLAGERIAQYLAETMVDNFELFNQKDTVSAKKTILRDIYRIIESLMKKYGMPKEEFASTLMALVLDSETDCYCAIHLGDGIIACIEDELKILSYPDHGFCENKTYLTISEHALQQMRVICGSIGKKRKFALVSDGGYESEHFEKDILRVIRKERFETCSEDDQSFVCLKNKR